jgi:hypothetical protein
MGGRSRTGGGGLIFNRGGGLIFNRAPALLRRALCVFRAPRPRSRRPEKAGTPERSATSFERGGAHI